MTRHQIVTLRRLTNRVVETYRHDGTWEFNAEMIGNKVMISGSNSTDLRWFETHRMLLAFVGPLGGIKFSPHSDVKGI